jgi:cytochrome b6-f complex iron-sulfur subunit
LLGAIVHTSRTADDIVGMAERMTTDSTARFRSSPPPTEAKRRDLLGWLLGIWGAGVLGSTLYPVLRFLSPPDVPEATSLTVSAGKASSLLPNSGRLVPFGAEPAIVVRLPGGELRAFTAVCTHLSCTVQYRDDLQQIWCACHNGHYDLAGGNVSGPPPRPLKPYDVNVKGDEIILSRNT